MVKIYETDNPKQIADKIYNHFGIGENVTVKGYIRNDITEEIEEIGMMVIKELEYLDRKENCRMSAGKYIRRHSYQNKSIGGPIAQKIFQWDRKIVDRMPRYFIFRFQ